MPWLALAAGAGAGLLKSEFVDRPQEQRDRALAAATQRYSPWTGLQAQPIKKTDPVGSALQFGMTGAGLQQGVQQMDNQDALSQAYQDYLKSGTSQNAAQTAQSFGQGVGQDQMGPDGQPMSPWGLMGRGKHYQF